MPRHTIQVRVRHSIQVQMNVPRNSQNSNPNSNNSFTFVMIQWYRLVFLQLSLSYARVFSVTQRKILEFLVLLMALFSFTCLIYFHIVFVHLRFTCFEKYQKDWESADILRIEVLKKSDSSNYSLFDSYYKEHATKLQEVGLKPCPIVQQLLSNESSNTNMKNENTFQEKTLDSFDLLNCKLNESRSDKGFFENIYEDLGLVLNVSPPEELNIIEYALEYGYLRISPAMRNKLNLTVLFIVIDPIEDDCFGGFFHKFISDKFLGYEEFLICCVKYFAELKNFKGYLRNVGTEAEYHFSENGWWYHQSYIISLITMPLLIFSLVILLRFTNEQMLRCYPHFFNLTRNRMLSEGIPLLAAVFAIFGLLTVTTSYYDNPIWARNITFIVWLADLYDSICCQSLMSKRHWYRFFLLYFYVFYAYNNRFHGLNWQLNLLTAWLFILHSQLFFFHHYELPYYIQRYVFRVLENRQSRRLIASLIARGSHRNSSSSEPVITPQPDEPLSNLEASRFDEQAPNVITSVTETSSHSVTERSSLTVTVQDDHSIGTNSDHTQVDSSSLRNSSMNSSLSEISNELNTNDNHCEESEKKLENSDSKCHHNGVFENNSQNSCNIEEASSNATEHPAEAASSSCDLKSEDLSDSKQNVSNLSTLTSLSKNHSENDCLSE